MKAGAVFPGKRKIEVVALDEPRITAPTEVKLRMLEVGVCGTDREIASFHHGTPPEGFEFLVLGHEALGEVVETGPAVSRFQEGDLVVPMVRRPCPHPECAACRAERQDFCYTDDFRERGIKQQHGFMTGFVVDDEQYLNAVPRDLRAVAVLVEPLTIAEKALIQIYAIQQRLPWSSASPGKPHGRRAVVLGAGPVGLLGAMALVNAGFETFVYSREGTPNPRAALAAAFGARYFCSATVNAGQLASEVGNIDVVYEAAGATQTAFELLEVLGTDAVYCFTGVPRHGEPISIDAHSLLYHLVLKNQVILGTVNAGKDAFEAAIRDLGLFYRRWPDAVSALITGRYPIEEFLEPVFDRSGIKNIIVLDGRS
ncbi:MAG: glucose 1-dehydrogenase [Acidobacteriia bacterium]|nr:glucose 1-dehydrogenase [Terriglobia bacterium]